MEKSELIERAQRGDHDAFEILVRATLPRLDAAARLILRDPDWAKDAVQEAIIRAWRDLPTLRDRSRFDVWLSRLLGNACRDLIRRRRGHRLEVELAEIDTPDLADEFEAGAVRDALERGFRRLGPEQRTVIVLHYYLGLPVPEVAATLGVPVGTAKARLHRSIREMRAALDADARMPAGMGGGA